MSERVRLNRLSIELAEPGLFPPVPLRETPEQVVPLYRLALRIELGCHALICGSTALPLPDRSIHSIVLRSVLDYVIDEQAFLEECARVCVPDGTLTGIASHAGGFGHFDVVNAARYGLDVLRKGPSLPEISESGWRKHYPAPILEAVLAKCGYDDIRIYPQQSLHHEIRMAGLLARRTIHPKATGALMQRFDQPSPAASETMLRDDRWGGSLVFTARRC